MLIDTWHFSFTVADIERSVKFYRDVLGMELVHEQEQSNAYTRKFVGYPDAHLKVAQLKINGRETGRSGHLLELVVPEEFDVKKGKWTFKCLPVIPGLNDEDIPRILQAAAAAGAGTASWILLRLPKPVGALFAGWLAEQFPERRDRVLGRIRECRGGRVSDARFGVRMRGEGV